MLVDKLLPKLREKGHKVRRGKETDRGEIDSREWKEGVVFTCAHAIGIAHVPLFYDVLVHV